MEKEYLYTYTMKVSNNVDSRTVVHLYRGHYPDDHLAMAKAVNSVSGLLAHDWDTPPEEQAVTVEILLRDDKVYDSKESSI